MATFQKKLPNENDEQYIWRLCSAKEGGEQDLSWEELASIFNTELKKASPWTEASYRKPYQQSRKYYHNVFLPMTQESSSEPEVLASIMAEKERVYKEKVKLFDERRAYRSKLRDMARIEDKMDRLSEILGQNAEQRYRDVRPGAPVKGANDLLILVSDIHMGIAFDSFNGSYSREIAEERLEAYLQRILEIGDRHQACRAYVSVLGDSVSGNIHRPIDVENRETVIEQIKACSDMLADFVARLSEDFSHVYVNNVSGNHSRVSRKDEAHLLERIDNIIPWYLERAMRPLKNVTVYDGSEYGRTVAEFDIRGQDVVSVHGDLDGFSPQGVGKQALWLGRTPDIVCMGHLHTPGLSMVGGTQVIRSGALSGPGDNYTIEKRLTSKASQTTCVINADGIEAIYNVMLQR